MSHPILRATTSHEIVHMGLQFAAFKQGLCEELGLYHIRVTGCLSVISLESGTILYGTNRSNTFGGGGPGFKSQCGRCEILAWPTFLQL